MNIKTQKKLKSLTNLYEFILIEGNHDKNIMYEIPSHKILRINDIEFIQCGGFHTICKTYSNEFYSWGVNDFGQLGQGNYKSCNKPIKCLKN